MCMCQKSKSTMTAQMKVSKISCFSVISLRKEELPLALCILQPLSDVSRKRAPWQGEDEFK